MIYRGQQTQLLKVVTITFHLLMYIVCIPGCICSKTRKALRCFLQFQKYVEVQFEGRIKAFQSDWGGEFRSFTKVLSQGGIQHRVTCPHTSEQNGVADRKHRHIVESCLSLLAQASLPLKLWSHAFVHAVHLINRLPTEILQGQSPYERLFKTKPDYSQLRVFGYSCFPYLRPFNSHKLEFRSKQCTFLGYNSHQKGFKCLDSSGRLFLSRHVVFDEKSFPFVTFTQSGPAVASEAVQHHVQSCVPLVVSSKSSHYPQVIGSRGEVPRSGDSSPVVSTGRCSSPIEDGSTVSRSAVENVAEDVGVVSGSDQSSQGLTRDSQELPRSQGQNETQMEVSSYLQKMSNCHPMQTRSKSEIFKPKIFATELSDKEPTTIEEAFQIEAWTAAAQQEFDALLKNQTWELVPLPADRKAIGCKWVFKVKRHADGSVERYKGRLVVKGYLQEAGIDFQETFNPVVKPTTIRVVLTLAVSFGWQLRQVDINNAFLNGDLTEEIYML